MSPPLPTTRRGMTRMLYLGASVFAISSLFTPGKQLVEWKEWKRRKGAGSKEDGRVVCELEKILEHLSTFTFFPLPPAAPSSPPPSLPATVVGEGRGVVEGRVDSWRWCFCLLFFY